MKVVITDYQYEHISQEKSIIEGAGHTLVAYQLKNATELIPLLRDADAVITQYAEINDAVISNMESCRIIIKYGIGVNNIDAVAAAKKGIYVCNVPDYGVEEVANHAVTMLLMLAKKMPILTEAFRNGDWGYSSVVPLQRFAGSTIGLMGFGRIPQLVAKKLGGFDVRLIACDPFISKSACEKLGVKPVSFDELIKQSDYISIHCPLIPETEGMFNADVFKRMKVSSCIINTARGPVIDQEALIMALQQGEIRGAALDVFESEPLGMDSPLLHMDQVIATPHCAWYSEESIATLQRKVAEEVVNVLNGNEPWNCTNRGLLKRS